MKYFSKKGHLLTSFQLYQALIHLGFNGFSSPIELLSLIKFLPRVKEHEKDCA